MVRIIKIKYPDILDFYVGDLFSLNFVKNDQNQPSALCVSYNK